MSENIESAWTALRTLRERRPLVHSITNLVVMNTTANALLALGASPIMAHAEGELEEIVALADALVLNLGTLDPGWVASMRAAAAFARQREVPIVMDPVGAGASRLRTETALQIAADGVSAIRANASEAMALAGAAGRTHGVDSVDSSADAEHAAAELARNWQCTVAVSGQTDFISDGEHEAHVRGGDQLMPLVTGMGCTATAIVGACCAVSAPFSAAVTGMVAMKAAGRAAAGDSRGPGSFWPAFLDALHNTDRETLKRGAEIA